MPYPKISYRDGLGAAVELSVYCYNNGQTYVTFTGDPSSGAQQTILTDSDKVMIGSVTFLDGRKGTLNCQYKLAQDELPGAHNILLPSYIVAFRNRFYVVGNVKTPVVKNDLIKISVDVLELENPFVPILLTLRGQQFAESFVSGGSHTVACAASGTRPGATVAYTVETFATEGSLAPSGFTINASTGVLTVGSGVTAGTYDVRVVVSDTITNADGTTDEVRGFGRYTPTLT